MTVSLQDLAAAALGLLAADGPRGDGSWRLGLAPLDTEALEITCTGPDLPAIVPAEIAGPEQVMRERGWTGTYRLVVRAARLIVLDLYWTPGQPARIMGFSRGDWEAGLLAAAQGANHA